MIVRLHRARHHGAACLLVAATALACPARAEPGLSLEQAIRRALSGPRLLAARELVTQARAEARTASLLPNPSLTVEAGLLPLSRRYTVDEPGGPTELAVGLQLPLDWLLFGKRQAARASAEAAVSVAEAELADLARRRAAETAFAFYSVLEADALLELAREAVRHLEQLEAVSRRAVASGGRPQIELGRARLELAAARRDERSAVAAALAARAGLLSLIGPPGPASALRVAGTLAGPLGTLPLPARAALAAAQDRPDLQALRLKAEKARRDLRLERRNAFPETSLGLGVAHQFQRSIGAPDVTAWGTSLEMALPLFNRNQGNREKAASARAQAEHELAAAHVELRAELEQAAAALVAARENALAVSRSELGLAGEVQASFRKAFEAGGRSLVEMLDAQRTTREARRAFVTTRAEYWRSLCRYNASLGRRIIP